MSIRDYFNSKFRSEMMHKTSDASIFKSSRKNLNLEVSKYIESKFRTDRVAGI